MIDKAILMINKLFTMIYAVIFSSYGPEGNVSYWHHFASTQSSWKQVWLVFYNIFLGSI